MSWALAGVGACVLTGIIDSKPVFGLESAEVDMVLGVGFLVFAFGAWVVERFTDEGAR